MEEETFFDRDGITVTQTRFIVHGETYTMQGVTSIRRGVEVEEQSKGCPIGLIVIGGISVLAGFISFSESVGAGIFTLLIGGAIIFGGVKWYQSKKTITTYTVTLSSASGEKRALAREDQAFIDQIVAALNKGIVARG